MGFAAVSSLLTTVVHRRPPEPASLVGLVALLSGPATLAFAALFLLASTMIAPVFDRHPQAEFRPE